MAAAFVEFDFVELVAVDFAVAVLVAFAVRLWRQAVVVPTPHSFLSSLM